MTPTDEQAIAFIRDLVDTPSVSGNEAAAVERFIAFADLLGFETETDEAGNGIARCGDLSESATEIALLGHIDTVPGDIPVRIEDGILDGRGSVDAKGPLAAMLCAAARAELSEGVRCTVIAALGEETPHSPGANHVRSRLSPAACVIGEPSGWDGVTLGYKGRLVIHARAETTTSHSAGPEESATDLLLNWWRRVLDRIDAFNNDHTRLFDRVLVSARSISSGGDGLNEWAEIRGGFRLPPALGPDEMEALCREAAPDQLTIEVEGKEVAHAVTRSDPVVQAISSAIRDMGAQPRPKLKTGTADLNVVGPVWNCPIAAYGPGDSTLDHTPHEHLVLDEYLKSIGVLATALPRIAASVIRV
ncbi:MAG: [LysW]-lysine hydrolase [Planctomycetota bacterium]